MENKKKLAVNILYMLGFLGLISSFIGSMANLIFIYIDNKILSFLNLTNWLILIFSFVCLVIITLNFFLKRKYDWIEIALFIASIILIIVLAILGKEQFIAVKTDSYASIYSTYLISFFTNIATFVILLVSKLINKFCFKSEAKNEEK